MGMGPYPYALPVTRTARTPTPTPTDDLAMATGASVASATAASEAVSAAVPRMRVSPAGSAAVSTTVSFACPGLHPHAHVTWGSHGLLGNVRHVLNPARDGAETRTHVISNHELVIILKTGGAMLKGAFTGPGIAVALTQKGAASTAVDQGADVFVTKVVTGVSSSAAHAHTPGMMWLRAVQLPESPAGYHRDVPLRFSLRTTTCTRNHITQCARAVQPALAYQYLFNR